MRILGIDPGIATVGFGVISSARHRQELVSCGAVTTEAGQPLSDRLNLIFDDILHLIDAFAPEAIAVEELFFNTNITTAMSVAHGRGVILLACRRAGVPVYEYTPLQVKQAVVGYGRAEKKQVIDMVKRMLNMKSAPKPDDAADALAIALCHARSATSLLAVAKNGFSGKDGTCSTI